MLRLKMCASILEKTVFPKCEIYLIIISIVYLSDVILEIAVPSNGMDIALLNQKTGICWVKSHPSEDSSSSQWNSNYLGLSWALNNCCQHGINTCAFLPCFQEGGEISWNQTNFS